MIEQGYQRVKEYLDHPTPNTAARWQMLGVLAG